MKPALTVLEWVEIKTSGCVECYTLDKKIPIDKFTEPEDVSRHGLAALCLHEQEFGFTREDVELIRTVAWRVPFAPWNDVLNIADRIEALLPPEESDA